VVTLANQLNAGELVNSYTYAFNTKGLRNKVTYANGSWADFTYDVVGQLTDEHYKDAQDNSLLQLTYTYDKAGNRTEKKYDNDGSRVETYTVNGYNQLTAVAGTAREYTNVCGLLDESNVDTVTVTNASLSEDAPRVDLMHDYFIGRKLPLQNGDNNIEVTVTDLAGNSTTAGSGGTYDFDQEEDINVKYEYDVRGNMVLKQVWDGEAYVDKERYFYNYENLIEYIWYASGDNDDKHPHFVYDGLNRRVRIKYGTVTLDAYDQFEDFDENTTKEYVFLGTQPIIEYDYDSGEETREVARQNYWGLDIVAGIGGLLYQKVPGGTPAYYYYHYDGTGNVTAITDSTKTVKALYEYDAFGNIITKAGTLANDFTFSTQMAYGASGWSMYMFRNYSPRLGRWTQRDPIGLPAGLNPYGYCRNQGTNAVDALGLFGISCAVSSLLDAVWAIASVVLGGDPLGIGGSPPTGDSYGMFVDSDPTKPPSGTPHVFPPLPRSGGGGGIGPDLARWAANVDQDELVEMFVCTTVIVGSILTAPATGGASIWIGYSLLVGGASVKLGHTIGTAGED